MGGIIQKWLTRTDGLPHCTSIDGRHNFRFRKYYTNGNATIGLIMLSGSGSLCGPVRPVYKIGP